MYVQALINGTLKGVAIRVSQQHTSSLSSKSVKAADIMSSAICSNCSFPDTTGYSVKIPKGSVAIQICFKQCLNISSCIAVDFSVNSNGSASCIVKTRRPPVGLYWIVSEAHLVIVGKQNSTVYLRVPGNVTLNLISASSLLCRATNLTVTTPCIYPFSTFNFVSSTHTSACCYDPSTHQVVVFVGNYEASFVIVQVDFLKNQLTADGYSIQNLTNLGMKSDIVRMFNSLPSIVQAVVTGQIIGTSIDNRGTNFTCQPAIAASPLNFSIYRSSTLWAFTSAVFTANVGFSGSTAGVFDGSNLDFMCSKSDELKGVCDRAEPYGKGYDSCIAIARARNGRAVASSSPVSVNTNVTLEVPTEGPSALQSFKINGKQFLAVASYTNMSFLKSQAIAMQLNSSMPFSPSKIYQPTLRARKSQSVVYHLSLSADGSIEARAYQYFDTISARDVQYTYFEGSHFLIFIQESSPVSPLFKWSEIKEFQLIQSIPTFGARESFLFQIDWGQSLDLYLMIAQNGNAVQCSLADQLSEKGTGPGACATVGRCCRHDHATVW